MNILITGSDGFVGKNLKEYFQTTTTHIVKSPSYKVLDLRDSVKVKNYLSKNKFDIIIHSATVLQNDKTYIDNVCEENLRMFFNIYQFKNKKTILINLGSGSEFNRDDWIPKMANSYLGQNIPTDGHSLSKYITAQFISNSNDNNLYHLRIFGIFGKYEDYLYKFISNSIVKILLDLPIVINQDCKYHYLYITDFCKIVEKLINLRPNDKIINTVPPKYIKLTEIVKIIYKITGKEENIKILKNNFGKEYTGSNKELSMFFNDFTKPEKSIEELICFYKKRIPKIKKDLAKIKNDKFLSYAKKINK